MYWIGYSNQRPSAVNRCPSSCFNPCCIGLGIQTCAAACRFRRRSRVSILVVLDWVFKPGRNTLTPAERRVSILVVLDWVFKPDEVPGHRARGCVVSILVVLDWVFKPTIEGDVVLNPRRFQSLLYWIGYSNNTRLRKFAHQSIRFNPCCIGLGIQTWLFFLAYLCPKNVSILVVLDWVFKLAVRAERGKGGGLFQSLLYWIGYSNKTLTITYKYKLLVSILVVLDWVFKRPAWN